jgi:hypothetical protein
VWGKRIIPLSQEQDKGIRVSRIETVKRRVGAEGMGFPRAVALTRRSERHTRRKLRAVAVKRVLAFSANARAYVRVVLESHRSNFDERPQKCA